MPRAQSRLRPLLPFLRANARQRRHMIQNKQVINCFCEMVQNVLKGHVKLTRGQKQRWSRHKHKLRRLVSGKTNTLQRSRLVQKGGFLPLLIPLATKLLGGLFG